MVQVEITLCKRGLRHAFPLITITSVDLDKIASRVAASNHLISLSLGSPPNYSSRE